MNFRRDGRMLRILWILGFIFFSGQLHAKAGIDGFQSLEMVEIFDDLKSPAELLGVHSELVRYPKGGRIPKGVISKKTYRFTFDNPYSDEFLALYKPKSGFMEAKYYINGKEYHVIGDGNLLEGHDVAASVFFTFINPKTPQIELIVQTVAKDRSTYLFAPIYVGKVAPVSQKRLGYIVGDSFMIGIMSILCVYHIFLYLFRRSNLSTLTFSATCAVAITRVAETGFGAIGGDFLGWSVTFHTLLVGLEIPLSGFFMAIFLNQMNGGKILGKKFYMTIGSFVGIVVLYAFVDTYEINNKIELFQLAGLFGMFACLYTSGVALYRKRNIVTIISFSSVIGLSIFAFLEITFYAEVFTSIPIDIINGVTGFFLTTIAQSIALSIMFNGAFDQVERSERKIKKLNHELEEHNRNLESIVKDKTKHIKAIMENIKIGIFQIKDDGRLLPDSSQHLKQLVGHQHLEGRHIDEILFDKAKIDSDKLESMKTSIFESFGEPVEFGWNVNNHLMIKEFPYQKGEEIRDYEVSYDPGIDETNQEMDALFVTVRDITEINKLREEAKKASVDNEILVRLIKSPEKIMGYVDKVISDQQEIEKHLKSFDQAAIDILHREFHTIKGSARSLGLSELAQLAHDVEEVFGSTKSKESPSYFQLMDQTALLYKTISNYQKVYDRYLKDFIKSKALSEKLFEDFFLEYFNESIEANSKELGIEAPMVEIRNASKTKIPVDVVQDLFNCINHLVNNSLAHGVEPKEERLSKGKKTKGTIFFNVSQNDQLLSIESWDDGRGLNLSKIYRKAIRLGLADKGLNVTEIANLILTPEFSTAEEVNQIRGRGVGVGIIQDFCHQYRGEFSVCLDSSEVDSLDPESILDAELDIFVHFKLCLSFNF